MFELAAVNEPSVLEVYHYENTPIHIYKKNSPPKTENFQIKN